MPRSTLGVCVALLLSACGSSLSSAPTAVPPTDLPAVPTIAVITSTAPPVTVVVTATSASETATTVLQPTDLSAPTAEPPTPTEPAPSSATPAVDHIEINFPGGGGNEFTFEAGFFNNTPEEIKRAVQEVQFVIRDPDANNQIVHERTERNWCFCAFGGGDNGAECQVWRLIEHANQWPSGAQAVDGRTYELTTIVVYRDGFKQQEKLQFTVNL